MTDAPIQLVDRTGEFKAGDEVVLRVGADRGVTWMLDQLDDRGRWTQLYAVNDPAEDVPPRVYDLSAGGFISPDLGVRSPITTLGLPPDLAAGVWRACPWNSDLGCVTFGVDATVPPALPVYQPEGRSPDIFFSRDDDGVTVGFDTDDPNTVTYDVLTLEESTTDGWVTLREIVIEDPEQLTTVPIESDSTIRICPRSTAVACVLNQWAPNSDPNQ